MGLIHGGASPDLGNSSQNPASEMQQNGVQRPAVGAEQFLGFRDAGSVTQPLRERKGACGKGGKEMASIYQLLIQ